MLHSLYRSHTAAHSKILTFCVPLGPQKPTHYNQIAHSEEQCTIEHCVALRALDVSDQRHCRPITVQLQLCVVGGCSITITRLRANSITARNHTTVNACNAEMCTTCWTGMEYGMKASSKIRFNAIQRLLNYQVIGIFVFETIFCIPFISLYAHTVHYRSMISFCVDKQLFLPPMLLHFFLYLLDPN